MDAAEVVIGKVQRDSPFQVVPLFGKTVGKPREPSHARMHGQTLAFYIGCADLVEVGFTLDGHWNRVANLSWAVALPGFFVARI